MGNRLRETRRLILSRWRIEDEQPFAEICADPDVMRFIGDGSTRTSGQLTHAIQIFQDEWEQRRDGLFAVDLRSTGELIGFAGFSRPDFLPELLLSVEIGWRFGKAHRGKGYAIESARMALDIGGHAFADEELIGVCKGGIGASVRIMQKIELDFDRRTVDSTCGREVEVYRLAR